MATEEVVAAQEVVKAVPENRRDKVFCSYTKLVPIGEVKEHPKNPNHHDREQIEILANAIKATGWRTPIGISKRSGFIIRGHGRFAAAKALGLTEVPVDFQDYDSESQELADLLADNKIADLGQIDYEGVSGVLKSLPQDQLAFTGFRDFEITPLLMAEWIKPALADMPKQLFTYKFSVNEQENEAVRSAIKIIQSKTTKTLTDGECLEIMANHYLGKVIKEEAQAEVTPKRLSEDIPKNSTVVATPKIVAPTVLVNTVGSPRTFKIDRVAGTMWNDTEADVVKSVDGTRYYTNDSSLVALAREAKEKDLAIKVTVEMKEKDFWLTSLVIDSVGVAS